MNIMLLKEEVIKAYQKVYLHQEIEKQKRGHKTSSAEIEKRLIQLNALIQDIGNTHNLVSLQQELDRCQAYFHLHPDAQKLPMPITPTQGKLPYKRLINYVLRRWQTRQVV
jgi:hypothetical protein